MRRRGQFFASRGSRRILVCDEFADMDGARLRTVCGQFVSAANACPRTVETVMRLRMRTACDRACGRGLSADMDCSRTRINRVRGLFPTGLRSWTCQGSGHGTEISRGRSACLPRLIRGRRSLVRSRGNACVREKDEVPVIVRYENKFVRRTCGSVRSSLSVLARLVTVGSEVIETTSLRRRDEETSVRRFPRLRASMWSEGQAG